MQSFSAISSIYGIPTDAIDAMSAIFILSEKKEINLLKGICSRLDKIGEKFEFRTESIAWVNSFEDFIAKKSWGNYYKMFLPHSHEAAFRFSELLRTDIDVCKKYLSAINYAIFLEISRSARYVADCIYHYDAKFDTEKYFMRLAKSAEILQHFAQDDISPFAFEKIVSSRNPLPKLMLKALIDGRPQLHASSISILAHIFLVVEEILVIQNLCAGKTSDGRDSWGKSNTEYMKLKNTPAMWNGRNLYLYDILNGYWTRLDTLRSN